jgi:putative hemolysin
MEIFILVSLIMLNGLFAMSEIAIVTARKSRLTALAHNGRSSAAIALKLAEDPTQFLSTVQIGITSIGILNGIFGEAVLAGPFSQWLQSYGLSEAFSSIFATVLVVVVVTYVSIVVGELVPKRIGQISAETIA